MALPKPNDQWYSDDVVVLPPFTVTEKPFSYTPVLIALGVALVLFMSFDRRTK